MSAVSEPTPDREPTLNEIEAALEAASPAWEGRGDDKRTSAAYLSLISMAPEWLAYLCTRVREAESERDALAEAFDGEFPLGPDEWIEVRNAWKRRAEAAEARVTALEALARQLSESLGECYSG